MERDLKCMYCAEAGITNTDVFIEIVDVELGAGWICKECFIESEKEKEEHLKELEQELKAKEQECEELKEKVKKYGEINEQETKDYAELKTEYDKLKTENDELRQFLSKEPLAIQALQKSYESYQKSTEVFSDWVKDYKQLIAEIKEIARVNSINTCWTAINLCADCDEIEECGLQSPFEKLKAIIQKINECGVMDE